MFETYLRNCGTNLRPTTKGWFEDHWHFWSLEAQCLALSKIRWITRTCWRLSVLAKIVIQWIISYFVVPILYLHSATKEVGQWDNSTPKGEPYQRPMTWNLKDKYVNNIVVYQYRVDKYLWILEAVRFHNFPLSKPLPFSPPLTVLSLEPCLVFMRMRM